MGAVKILLFYVISIIIISFAIYYIDSEDFFYFATSPREFWPLVLVSLCIVLLVRLLLRFDRNASYNFKDSRLVRCASFVTQFFMLVYFCFFISPTFFSESVDNKVIDLTQRIISSQKRLDKLNEQALNVTAAGIGSDDFSPITSESLEIAERIDSHKARIESYKISLEQLKKKQVEEKEAKSYKNRFFVLRALSLGALGALIGLIAKSTLSTNINNADHKRQFLSMKNYWSNLVTFPASGAVVSVVVFSLFYTQQISLFNSDNSTNEIPDYWRTTMMCIISGLFAERIYTIVSAKFQEYFTPTGPPRLKKEQLDNGNEVSEPIPTKEKQENHSDTRKEVTEEEVEKSTS